MLRYRTVQGVVTHAEVQRRPLDHPLILTVDTQTVGVFDHLERRGPDRDRLRDAIPERVGSRAGDLVLVVVLPLPAEVILLQEVPGFEAVRSGDVRGRET